MGGGQAGSPRLGWFAMPGGLSSVEGAWRDVVPRCRGGSHTPSGELGVAHFHSTSESRIDRCEQTRHSSMEAFMSWVASSSPHHTICLLVPSCFFQSMHCDMCAERGSRVNQHQQVASNIGIPMSVSDNHSVDEDGPSIQ